MTTSKKNITPPHEEPLDFYSVDEYDDEDAILIDKTSHADIKGKAIRVELRRTREPLTGESKGENRLLEPKFIIGLLEEASLPKEGEDFKIAYHILNNETVFGKVEASEPIHNLEVTEDAYFFSTSEGSWRLKILDSGN